MNELAIDVLYDYMLHILKVENGKELMDAADVFETLLPRDKYIELEPYINKLISASEKQGFARAIQLFVNSQIKTATPIMYE